MFAALALAATLAATETAVNRVALYAVDDAVYRDLPIPASVRTNPDSGARLVVFRDGVPILDRGLLQQRDAAKTAVPGMVEERGLVEEVILASDGSAAVVRQTRYHDRRSLREPGESGTLTGNERLTWIDPDRPGGRWSVDLPAGRFVKEGIVAPLGSGAAVILTDSAGLGGEIRVFGPDGKETARIAPPEGEAVDAAAAADAPVLAVDIAYPARAGTPDRAIVVFDLTHGTRWTYGWSYGSDEEPRSWSIDADGALVVELPAGARRFDRDGASTSKQPAGRGPFNRLRGTP
ncbi:MAG TPA: hypothetical protein VF139_11935 [Candidatus Polarisedimenticolaceae bacterium]